MRWMAPCVLALALVATACAGTDQPEATSAGEPSSEITEPEAVADPEPEPDSEPSTEVEPATEPATDSALEPPADIDDSNIAELARLRYDAGGDTVETALLAFAMQFGSLPGIVEAPPPDGLRAPSATGAIETIVEVWPDLDEPTRDAVRNRIIEWLETSDSDDPDDSDDPADGGDSDADAPDVPDEDAAGVVQLASFAPRSGHDQREWELRMETMETAIRSRLGGDPLDWEVQLLDPADMSADALTGPDIATLGASYFDVLGIPGFGSRSCVFSIGGARDLPPLAQEGVAAHEMFHCWSLSNAATLDAHIATPDWFQEGIATWVGETLAAPASGTGSMTGWVRLYLNGYTTGAWPLFLSDYDALGFWYYVEDQGADLWSVIPNLFTVAQSGDDAQLLAAVDGLLPGDGLASAASGPVREDGWGNAWTMGGASLPVGARRPFRDTARRGDPSVLSALPGVQGYAKVAIESPVDDEPFIFQFQGVGYARARWASGEEIVMAGESIGEAWCVGGDCVCPDGSPPPVPLTSASGATGPVAIAPHGGPDTSTDVEITILSLEDVCEPTTCAATDDAEFDRGEPGPGGTTAPAPPAPAEPGPGTPEECLVDACVAGSWVAAQTSEVERYLTTLYRAAGVTPIFERGTMGAEFRADGTAVFTLDAVWGATLPGGEEGVISTMSVTDALWSAADGVLEYTVLQIRQDTTVEAGPVIGTGPPVIGGGIDDPVGSGSVSYSCEGGRLLIEGGVAFFPLPTEWIPA